MDPWMDEWKDKWIDTWTGGWMSRWAGRWMDSRGLGSEPGVLSEGPGCGELAQNDSKCEGPEAHKAGGSWGLMGGILLRAW